MSQVFPPDAAAVGRPLADVADEMARRGWRVVVVTAANGYEDPTVRYLARETLRGVRVRRLPMSSFGKATLAHRVLGGGLFLAQALAYGLFIRRATVVLVSTSPPFAGFAGAILAWLRGLPVVWWVMDLNPDQLVATGQIASDAWPVRLFEAMNRLTLRLSRCVIVLDRFMWQRVAAKADIHAGSPECERRDRKPRQRSHQPAGSRRRLPGSDYLSGSPERERRDREVEDHRRSTIHIIPPWSAARPARWRPPWPNSFRDAHGLDRKFIVMYSGNHAAQHPLDTLLDAAARLEHDGDTSFLFVGGGVGKTAIDARIQNGATNLMSLPFQPAEQLDELLAAADVHVVSMGDPVVGIVHPCKMYGALAVGRPVLFLGPVQSPPAELLTEFGTGRQVEHGDVDGAVAAIQELRSLDPKTRAAMGQAAARSIATRFGACELCRDVCDLIERSRAVGGLSMG